MNLGELKAIVNTWTNDSYLFQCKMFMNPHSYRGYYNELAFEYCDSPLTVADIKQFVREAGTDTFTGWKGGEYTYDDNTPVHLSEQGHASDEEGSDFVELVFAMDREYRSFNSKMCYNTPMETNTETKMATKRKTAAEKRAEAEALRLEQEARDEATFRAEYHLRLLKLLHVFARELPTRFFAIKFGEEKQAFKFAHSDHDYTVVLPLDMDGDDFRSLEYNFETAYAYVQAVVEERKEAELREMKRRVALSKLTEEERKLLGL